MLQRPAFISQHAEPPLQCHIRCLQGAGRDYYIIRPPKEKNYSRETSKALQAVNLQSLIWCARKDSNLHGVAPTRT